MASSIPVVSQIRSAFQATCGDLEGARRTQERFLKTCPVVSQATSAVQLLSGNEEGAKNTQLEFIETVSGFVDGVPIVGHVKGAFHYACGDMDGGDQAVKRSSRTTAVIAGGAGGFVIGGPVGAFCGGVVGGLTADGATTAVESAIKDEYRPSGTIATVTNIATGNSESRSGDAFDVVVGTITDGFIGKGAGKFKVVKWLRKKVRASKPPPTQKIPPPATPTIPPPPTQKIPPPANPTIPPPPTQKIQPPPTETKQLPVQPVKTAKPEPKAQLRVALPNRIRATNFSFVKVFSFLVALAASVLYYSNK